MWLIPFTHGSEHTVDIDLGCDTNVFALKIWNYNKGSEVVSSWSEEILRGARRITIFVDNNELGKWELRVGPGCDGVDFGQIIPLRQVLSPSSSPSIGFASTTGRLHSQPNSITPPVKQDYEVQLNPTGLLWRFVFHDNWNDGYYLGLDAVHFIDTSGKTINILEAGATVAAVPHSLLDLTTHSGASIVDPRSPVNLFHSTTINPTRVVIPGSHMKEEEVRDVWLCPLSRCMTDIERNACAFRLQAQPLPSSELIGSKNNGDGAGNKFRFPVDNTLFVMFPYPVTIACIKFFNFSKTPTRGVR